MLMLSLPLNANYAKLASKCVSYLRQQRTHVLKFTSMHPGWSSSGQSLALMPAVLPIRQNFTLSPTRIWVKTFKTHAKHMQQMGPRGRPWGHMQQGPRGPQSMCPWVTCNKQNVCSSGPKSLHDSLVTRI